MLTDLTDAQQLSDLKVAVLTEALKDFSDLNIADFKNGLQTRGGA